MVRPFPLGLVILAGCFGGAKPLPVLHPDPPLTGGAHYVLETDEDFVDDGPDQLINRPIEEGGAWSGPDDPSPCCLG